MQDGWLVGDGDGNKNIRMNSKNMNEKLNSMLYKETNGWPYARDSTRAC